MVQPQRLYVSINKFVTGSKKPVRHTMLTGFRIADIQLIQI